jgi:hypothetical protein
MVSWNRAPIPIRHAKSEIFPLWGLQIAPKKGPGRVVFVAVSARSDISRDNQFSVLFVSNVTKELL